MSNQSLFSSIYGAKPYEAIAVILYAQLQLVMTNILIGIYTIGRLKSLRATAYWGVTGYSCQLAGSNLTEVKPTRCFVLGEQVQSDGDCL